MIRADALFADVSQQIYDAVILPGGLKGAEAFAAVRLFGIIPRSRFVATLEPIIM